MAAPILAKGDPTVQALPLCLVDAKLLLDHEYLPLESGYGIAADGMHHVAASTWMPNCTGAMIDWWFGYIHHTDDYKQWHPRDHVFSDWDGPRDNNSTYIGGHHLVHEYIAGDLLKLKISFRSPAIYFGDNWEADFRKAGYATAVCARTGIWDEETGDAFYTGHMIHLVRNEPEGCRMRSRFWMGDVESVTDPVERASMVPPEVAPGLQKHACEEMAILASKLPALFAQKAQPATKSAAAGHRRRRSNL